MTKAEERALEAYPYSKGKVVATGFGTIEVDQNHDERVGFVEGYNQASKDYIEYAQLWVDSGEVNIKSFKQFLKDRGYE